MVVRRLAFPRAHPGSASVGTLDVPGRFSSVETGCYEVGMPGDITALPSGRQNANCPASIVPGLSCLPVPASGFLGRVPVAMGPKIAKLQTVWQSLEIFELC